MNTPRLRLSIDFTVGILKYSFCGRFLCLIYWTGIWVCCGICKKPKIHAIKCSVSWKPRSLSNKYCTVSTWFVVDSVECCWKPAASPLIIHLLYSLIQFIEDSIEQVVPEAKGVYRRDVLPQVTFTFAACKIMQCSRHIVCTNCAI